MYFCLLFYKDSKLELLNIKSIKIMTIIKEKKKST